MRSECRRGCVDRTLGFHSWTGCFKSEGGGHSQDDFNFGSRHHPCNPPTILYLQYGAIRACSSTLFAQEDSVASKNK